MNVRKETLQRKTNETNITLTLNLDGKGETSISTGLGFLDHMLASFAKHARFDLDLQAKGDLHVDDHHTAEDVALVLGEAFNRCLGDKAGIARFGDALLPMDEALAQAAIDISGRPFAHVSLQLQRDKIGDIATENITHALISFAMAAKLTMHLDILRGENDHHKAEAAFKALALALRKAVKTNGENEIPSTKGILA